MSDLDHGIAGAVGAALAGAGMFLKRLVAKDPKPAPTAEEFAGLVARVDKLEKTMSDLTDTIGGLRAEVARLTDSNDQRDERLDAVRISAAKLEAIVERMEKLGRRDN